MQIVLRGNDEYDLLITDRYRILDILKSKEPITNETKTLLQDDLESINKRISDTNSLVNTF